MENRRDDQPDGRKHEQRRPDGNRRPVKALCFEFQATGNHAGTQHQQGIADDRTGNRGLDHLEQTFFQCHQPDNQFCRIAKGGVEQPADACAVMLGQMFGGVTHLPCQRNDAQSGGNEDPGRIAVKKVQHDANRDENQHRRQGRKLYGSNAHFVLQSIRMIRFARRAGNAPALESDSRICHTFSARACRLQSVF